jgi:hypothetical protein
MDPHVSRDRKEQQGLISPYVFMYHAFHVSSFFTFLTVRPAGYTSGDNCEGFYPAALRGRRTAALLPDTGFAGVEIYGGWDESPYDYAVTGGRKG